MAGGVAPGSLSALLAELARLPPADLGLEAPDHRPRPEMADLRLLSLKEWETFYVITGGAAAALTGLMFVVIALRAERAAEGHEGAVRAFATPTVPHFCGALLIAALLSIPSHTAASLALCVGTVGVAGLALSAWAAIQAHRQSWYAPVLSDWIWHVAMPMVVYTSIAVAAVVLWRRPAAARSLADPSDDVYMATALVGAAGWVVSGDRHLLALKRFAGVSIVTPANFLGELQRS